MKNILVIILFTQFLILTNAQAALELVDPDYDGNVALRAGHLGAGIMPQYTNQVGLDGVENIRVSAGTVNLVHKDISMPVSSDLSIDIFRYYTSPAKSEGGFHGNSYTGGKSALGIGWDIHMGRIRGFGYRKTTGETCRPELTSDLPVLELSDGSSYQLYSAKTTGKGAINFSLITENYWVADCIPDGMVAYSPNGFKYFFTEHSYVKDREKSALSVTRVEDKNGNFYTVSYKDVSIWNTDDPGVSVVTIRGVSEITSQDGRKIIFNYDANGRLNTVVTPTQTWLYSYESESRSGYDNDFYLRSVTGPESYRWQYDYIRSSDYSGWQEDINAGRGSEYGWYQVPGIFGLKQIITPYGAHVDYEYHLRKIEPLSTSTISAIAKKTVTGPGIDVPRVWNYKADDAISAYDSVLEEFTWESSDIEIMPYIEDISIADKANSRFYKIEGPDTIEILQYCETVTNNSPAYDAWSCVSQAGRATSKRLFKKNVDSEGNEDRANIELIQDIKYTRLFHTDITDMTRGVTVRFPVDIQVSVKRGDEYFNTITSNFDEFYNPSLISEFTGTPLTVEQLNLIGEIVIPAEPGRLQKQTRYTYVNNIVRGNEVNVLNDKWLMGLLESVTIVDSVDSFLRANTPNLFNVYDEFGNITSSKKHNLETLYTYEQKLLADMVTLVPTGEIARITDPLNKVTDFSRYKFGIAQEVKNDRGVTTVKVVNNAGNVESYRNRRGLLERYTYDLLNRVKTIDTPRTDDNNIVFDYNWTDPTFNYKKTVGEYVETVKLNGLGQVIEINKGGIKTTLNYDTTGRRNFVSNPNSPEGTMVVYDSLGRVTETTNTVDNTKTTYTYPSNLQTSIIDEEGNQTLLTYRAFSNPDDKELIINEQQSVADGSIVTVIERTQRGDVFRVAQGKSSGAYSGDEALLTELKERQYTYDDNYFVDKIHFPETGWNDVKKNAVGNQVRRQVDIDEPGVTPSGITNFIYDGLHRLETIDYPTLTTPNLVYAYDENDNVTKITSGGVILDYTYDLNDNLQTETITIDGTAYTMVYTYDANNALNTVEYPDGLIIDYKPNALGQATEVSGFVSAITYHPNGQINTLNYLNGQNITINQNPRLFTESVIARMATDTVNMSYTYDATGNTKTITDSIAPVNDLTLGYDDFNRLTQADGSWGNGLVEYNSRGNIMRKVMGGTDLTYNYNDNGNGTKLITITNTQAGTNQYGFNYDVYGNVETNGSNQFIYNDASHLTDVVNQNYKYRYDGNGNRAVIDENGYRRYSLYSKAGSLMYEYDISKETQTDYIRIGSYLVARRDNLGVCPTRDSDYDAIPDCEEYRLGLNPKLFSDGRQGDRDNDGLSNTDEYVLGTSMDNSDTDGDGIPDGFEVNNQLNPLDATDVNLDNDGDGILNLNEYQMGLSLYIGIDINNRDSDSDGIEDGIEIANLMNPVSTDSDNDSMDDAYEFNNGLNPLVDDSSLDFDGDGATNLREYTNGTSASDRKSLPDGDLKWRFVAEGTITGAPVIDDNGLIYFITDAGWVYAVEPDWSKPDPVANYKWRINLGASSFAAFQHKKTYRRLSIGPDGTLYVISDGDVLDVYSQTSSNYSYTYTYYNSGITHTHHQTLNAISPDGNIKWTYPLPNSEVLNNASISIGIDGTLYFVVIETGVSRNRSLIAINMDGTLKWKHELSTRFLTSPVIGRTGNLYFYDGGVDAISNGGYYVTLEDQGDRGVVLNSVENIYLNTLPASGNVNEKPIIDSQGNVIYFRNMVLNEDGTVKRLYSDSYDNGDQHSPVVMDYRGSLILHGTRGAFGSYRVLGFNNTWANIVDVSGYSSNKLVAIAATNSKTVYGTVDSKLYSANENSFDFNWVYDPGVVTTNKSVPIIDDGGDILYSADNILYKVSGSIIPSPIWPMEGRDRKNSSNACSKSIINITDNNYSFYPNPDTDGDLIPDCYEIQYGLSETNPLDAQFFNDSDGLTNLEEYNANTNPNIDDTDGDGVNDKIEVRLGFNPLYGDTDNDGIDDLAEYQSIFFTDIDNDGFVGAGDNCLLINNPAQFDSDNDNIGNACDADFNNDNLVNADDIIEFRSLLNVDNAIGDLNEDGVVTGLDYSILRSLQKSTPGPSGILVGE